MAVLKCKMCGGNLNVVAGESVAECEYCGSVQTVPGVDDERKLTLFARANLLRSSCEFDKAAGIYESIVADFPNEAEAYWGLVLCKYGIEYVDDPRTGRKIPTCHRTIPGSVFDDADYKAAYDKADVISKKVYHKEAEAIDVLQKQILEIVAKEEAYDIFICYKETDDDTLIRTDDSADAQDLYTELSRAGYRVFFARVTLKSKAGSEYEPYIYAALSSAKVMLVIGSKPEYFNAVWVKNEWSRFMDMAKAQSGKVLIPCYKNMDAYDMPKEFRNLQALNMSDVLFYSSLKNNLERVITKPKVMEPGMQTIGTAAGGAAAGVQADALLKRAMQFLVQEDWKRATEYADRILDVLPECADAYLVRLMSWLEIHGEQEFSNVSEEFEENWDYIQYIKYAPSHKAEEMKQRAETATFTSRYAYATSLGDTQNYSNIKEAIELLDTISGQPGVEEKKKLLIEKKNDIIYAEAGHFFAADDYKSWEKAGKFYSQIQDWRDSAARMKVCEGKCKDYIYNEALALKNKEIKYPDITDRNKNDYDPLKQKESEYNEAIKKFRAIDPWKDAREQIQECEELVKKLHYDEAIFNLNNMGTEECIEKALAIFEELGSWKDSEAQAEKCHKELQKLYDKQINELKKCKKRVKKSPIKLLVVVALFVIGIVLCYGSQIEKHPVIFGTISTLLTATPIFCIFGYEEGGWSYAAGKGFDMLKLRYCFLGYVILAIPVFVVWGILDFINLDWGIVNFIIKAIKVIIIIASGIGLIACIVVTTRIKKTIREIDETSNEIRAKLSIKK